MNNISESKFPAIDRLPAVLTDHRLLGTLGKNRADPDECLFQAEHDVEAVYRWLNQYRDNAHTLKNPLPIICNQKVMSYGSLLVELRTG